MSDTPNPSSSQVNLALELLTTEGLLDNTPAALRLAWGIIGAAMATPDWSGKTEHCPVFGAQDGDVLAETRKRLLSGAAFLLFATSDVATAEMKLDIDKYKTPADMPPEAFQQLKNLLWPVAELPRAG